MLFSYLHELHFRRKRRELVPPPCDLLRKILNHIDRKQCAEDCVEHGSSPLLFRRREEEIEHLFRLLKIVEEHDAITHTMKAGDALVLNVLREDGTPISFCDQSLVCFIECIVALRWAITYGRMRISFEGS